MESPSRRRHSAISGHLPTHAKKRTYESVGEFDISNSLDWSGQLSGSDSVDFDFNRDFVQELYLPSAASVSPALSTDTTLLDFSNLYTFDESGSSALSSPPSTPLASESDFLLGTAPETLLVRSAAETIQELHDESHVKRLELREQMDAEKGTRTAYPRHYSRYLLEWSLDQDQRVKDDPTRMRINAEPITATKVAHFLSKEAFRPKVHIQMHDLNVY